MKVWVPASNGVYGPVEVLSLERDVSAGSIVLSDPYGFSSIDDRYHFDPAFKHRSTSLL